MVLRKAADADAGAGGAVDTDAAADVVEVDAGVEVGRRQCEWPRRRSWESCSAVRPRRDWPPKTVDCAATVCCCTSAGSPAPGSSARSGATAAEWKA